MLCIPCIFFLVSAISFAISSSTSRLATSLGRPNIIIPLKSIMRTMGFFSIAKMLKDGAAV